MDSTRIVSSAVIGYDFRKAVVGGKLYIIHPPTIHRMAGAAYWLSHTGDVTCFADLLREIQGFRDVCKALSFFIQGDEQLEEELAQGTPQEVLDALETAFSLISPQDFSRLSRLRRSAATTTAKQST